MVQKTKKLLPRVQKHGHWVHLSLLELWRNGVFWFGLETEVFVVSFFFEETNITLEILCMGLCNNEYRHKYSIFQYSVLLLINNSMSLRNGKCFFLSMTCKETRLYSSGSFRYSLFLVLCLILLDRTRNSPSHLAGTDLKWGMTTSLYATLVWIMKSGSSLKPELLKTEHIASLWQNIVLIEQNALLSSARTLS